MTRELPVLDRPQPPTPSPLAAARRADRRVTVAGVAVSATFLVLAMGAAALPPGARLGTWLPLHLVLAGAAGTAVAATMPFFAATLSAGRPAPLWARAVVIGLVAAGALAVSIGFAQGLTGLAETGGLVYLLGLLGLLLVTLAPLPSGRRHAERLTMAAYVVSVLEVMTGVAIAVLFLGGDPAVAAAWGRFEPAHAWLNLLGFVSLVIVATLVHLLPTVLGTRIRQRPSSVVAIVATAAGAPLVAAGFALGWDALADLGAVAAVVGAAALLAFVRGCYRDRGRWTTDPGWHRATIWHLQAAVGWFALAVVLAAGRVLIHGATPQGWALAPVAAPLAVGWVVQTVLGAWGHILPSIGPGDAARHAHQRRVLGRLPEARLAGLNLGTAILTLGLVAAQAAATLAGVLLVVAVVAVELLLLVGAVTGSDRWGALRLASDR